MHDFDTSTGPLAAIEPRALDFLGDADLDSLSPEKGQKALQMTLLLSIAISLRRIANETGVQ